MPRGTLVIGVGGAGRGVINYLKKALEQEYGSPSDAGVVLYCIDGPVSDQYVLPGGYQLDTSEDSLEFYQPRKSPVDAIRTISQGNSFAHIEDWLSETDARKVPLTGIDPSAGMGGERVPGRSSLFLEVNELEPELRRILTEARTYLPRTADGAGDGQGTRVNIFLVGSQSGGTGSGLLLDVAQLLHQNKGRDRLIGVIVLPNSFRAVIDEPGDIVKRDAKAFCGIRELHRFMDPSTTRIRYSSNVEVTSSQLFELCFLVDGQGEHLDLGDSYPLYGFTPSISDLILATIKDTQHIEPNVINWIQSYIAPAATSEKFSAYGIHSFIYPDRDLAETFVLRFAQELYNRLLSPPAEAEEEGRELALGILSSFKFGEIAVDLEKGKSITSNPNEFGIFRVKIAIGKADAPFPEDPVLSLEEVVRVTAIFRPVTNAMVMQDCQNEAARYLGDSADTAPQTVWGWLNYQSDEIAKFFVEKLTRCIADIFYELQDDQHQPRPLDGKPYTIIVAGDLLQALLDSLARLKQALEEEHQRHLQRFEEGIQTDIITLQRRKVDETAESLMPGDARDKSAQREYILEYQKLLELQVWDALMRATSDLTERLHNLTDSLWQMVGDPAQGWISFFSENCRKRLQQRTTELISIRSKLSDIKVRRYFPSPNDRAEQAMFHDFVVETGLLNDLLRDMHWTFESTQSGQFGLSPKQDAESFQLLLHLREVPGYDKEKYQQNLTEVVTGRFRRVIVSTHSSEEIVQFGRNQLKDRLSNLSIWDAIHYDYQYEWLPRVLAKGGHPTVEAYVDGLMNDLAQKSSTLLSQRSTGAEGGVAAGVVSSSYCLSSFRSVPDATVDSVDALATVFHRGLQELGIASDDSSISKQIFRLNYQHRVPLQNWAYYRNGMGNYFVYLAEAKATPIHLFPAERNAAQLEQYLIQNHLITDSPTTVELPGVGVVPVRCLDLSVVRYLGDMEAFRNFTFVYSFGLIDKEEAVNLGDPDRYYLEIEGTTGTQRAYLGPVWDMNDVLSRFLSPDPQARAIREKVEATWGGFIKEKRQNPDWQKQLTKELQEKAGEISFASVPAGQQDSISRGDLKLAMQAVLYQLADTLTEK